LSRDSFLKITAAILIILLGAGIAFWFLQNRPRAPQEASVKEVPRVYVHKAKQKTRKVLIQAMGEVVPAREVALKPRVSGRVIEVFENFELGKVVQQDQKLLKIDPADYKLALRQKKGELSSTLADLELERGKQEVARKEWNMLANKTVAEDSSLALRKPQLNKVKANLKRLRAALDKARLDLERTLMRAPFDGLVTQKSVYKGSEIGTQGSVATLVDIGRYWVKASLPLNRLPWIEFASREGTGSKVEVISKSRDVSWQGRALRMLGELEEQGRMAKILVEVRDPVRRADQDSFEPMLLNDFVHLEIHGKKIEGVVTVPNSALHSGDKVWVASDDARLKIRQVDVLWENEEKAFIGSGLEPGAEVVTSTIATPLEGMEIEPVQE